MPRYLMWSIISWLVGVFLAINLSKQIVINHLFILMIVLCIGVLVIVLLIFTIKRHSIKWFLFLLIFISLSGFVYANAKTSNMPNLSWNDREQITINATITKAWTTNYNDVLIIKTQDEYGNIIKLNTRIFRDNSNTDGQNTNELLDNEESAINLVYRLPFLPGDIVSLTGEFRLASPKSNPGGFDETSYYTLQDWHGKLLTTEDNIEIVARDKSLLLSINRLLHNTRVHYQTILANHILAPAYMVSNALVMGDRNAMDSDMKALTRNLGIAALFALSGLHVGLIILIIIAISDRLHISRERIYIFLLVFLPVYCLLTGASPSIIRAVVMAELMIFAKLIIRQADVYTNLALAAFLLVLWQPNYIMHIGFQMTFLITLSIIMFEPMIVKYLPIKQGFTAWAFKLLSVTIAAQVFAFPLLVYYFNEFSLMVFVTQFIFLPIVSLLILPAGLFFLFTAWLHPAMAIIPIKILNYSSNLLLIISDKLAFSDQLMLKFAEVNSWWIFTYLGFAFFLAWTLAKYSFAIKRQLIAITCLLCLILTLWLPALPKNSILVTVIDVGQGDAIHINVGNNKHYLIDGGGWPSYGDIEYDIGRTVLLPYFQAVGVDTLDAVFLTHADYDHIHGLFAVLEELKVHNLIYGAQDEREIFTNLLELAASKNISVSSVSAGDKVNLSELATFTILHPNSANLSTNYNDQSMVKLLQYLDHQLLFTGDIEATTEVDLLNILTDKSIDILKVAHHGSISSSSDVFLDQIRPKYALISVGKNNRFSHPAPTVIQRIKQYDAAVWRTDYNGAIFIELTKNDIKINSMVNHQ